MGDNPEFSSPWPQELLLESGKLYILENSWGGKEMVLAISMFESCKMDTTFLYAKVLIAEFVEDRLVAWIIVGMPKPMSSLSFTQLTEDSAALDFFSNSDDV
jgi:hypothetical protein